MVRIPDPPPESAPRPIFRTLKSGTVLVRLFDPSRRNITATSFRHYGPLLRFDHHRAPNTSPADDPDRGIYYAALTLSCCVVETFGSSRVIDCGNWQVAQPRLLRPLKLL